MFGTSVKAASGLMCINALAAFVYTSAVITAGHLYEDAQLIDAFLADMSGVHWSAWFRGTGFFIAMGNLIPGLWLLLAYRVAPGRSPLVQVSVASLGAAVVAGGGYMLLFRTYANPATSPDAANLAVSILSWSGLWVMQLIGAIVVEAGDRIVRARRGSRGACVACGYFLATPAGRCPECGTVVE